LPKENDVLPWACCNRGAVEVIAKATGLSVGELEEMRGGKGSVMISWGLEGRGQLLLNVFLLIISIYSFVLIVVYVFEIFKRFFREARGILQKNKRLEGSIKKLMLSILTLKGLLFWAVIITILNVPSCGVYNKTEVNSYLIIKNEKLSGDNIFDFYQEYYKKIGGRVQLVDNEDNHFRFIVSGMRGEIIKNEKYWEKIYVSLLFNRTPTSIKIISILDGQYAPGIQRNPKSYYKDMDPVFSQDLHNYSGQLLVELKKYLVSSKDYKINNDNVLLQKNESIKDVLIYTITGLKKYLFYIGILISSSIFCIFFGGGILLVVELIFKYSR